MLKHGVEPIRIRDMAHLRQVALMIQQHLAPLMGATRGFYNV